jgi:hypothetical protein
MLVNVLYVKEDIKSSSSIVPSKFSQKSLKLMRVLWCILNRHFEINMICETYINLELVQEAQWLKKSQNVQYNATVLK